MYNEQLENLIRLAVLDGIITEQERQVLFKKAAEAGIDPEEFNMVLEARLHERKNQLNSSSGINRSITVDGEDKPGIGWQILAFLLPIAGLIMYFNVRSLYPNKAKSYLKFTIIGFIVNFIYLSL